MSVPEAEVKVTAGNRCYIGHGARSDVVLVDSTLIMRFISTSILRLVMWKLRTRVPSYGPLPSEVEMYKECSVGERTPLCGIHEELVPGSADPGRDQINTLNSQMCLLTCRACIIGHEQVARGVCANSDENTRRGFSR